MTVFLHNFLEGGRYAVALVNKGDRLEARCRSLSSSNHAALGQGGRCKEYDHGLLHPCFRGLMRENSPVVQEKRYLFEEKGILPDGFR